MTEQQAKDWLKGQAIWQIYLPATRRVPRPKFDVVVPNEAHQADLLFLPHDRVGQKTIRYALTVVDVASRCKEAQPLTSKTAAEVADGLARIYKRIPLRWPKLLQVEPGREFMGAVSQLLAKHGVKVVLTSTGTKASRSAGTGPWLSGSLDTSMFKRCASLRVRSTEWVARLPSVAMKSEVTRLTGKKPSDAIKAKTMAQKPSSVVPDRPVSHKEQRLPSGVGVRYLYQPSELEGGRRRATNPVWSLTVHRLGRSVTKPGEPVLYYLQDGLPRGFVREELLVVSPDTQLPPDGVLKR